MVGVGSNRDPIIDHRLYDRVNRVMSEFSKPEVFTLGNTIQCIIFYINVKFIISGVSVVIII